MFKWLNVSIFACGVLALGGLIALFHYTDTHAMNQPATQTAAATNSTNGIIAYDGVLGDDQNSVQSASENSLKIAKLKIENSGDSPVSPGDPKITGGFKVLGGGGGINLVTNAHSIANGAGTITTSSINTTGATLLVACISGYSAGYTIGSGTTGPITDSKGNTWHYLTNQGPSFADIQTQIAYSYNPTVGSGHTFTLTTATYSGAIAILAFSGTLTTSSVFDTQNGASSNSASSLSTGTVTPTVANELLVSCAGLVNNSNAGQTVTNGFAVVDQVTGINSATLSSAYLVYPATTPNSTTWSQTTASEEGVTIAAFKPTSIGSITFH